MQRFIEERRGAPLFYHGACDEWYRVYTYAEASAGEVIERANIEAFKRELAAATEGHSHESEDEGFADECYRAEYFGGAFGRGEWLFVNPACEAAVTTAKDVLARLADYPVIDEELWSEYEWDDAIEACRDALYKFIPYGDEEASTAAACEVLHYAMEDGTRDISEFWPTDEEVFWGYVQYRRSLKGAK